MTPLSRTRRFRRSHRHIAWLAAIAVVALSATAAMAAVGWQSSKAGTATATIAKFSPDGGAAAAPSTSVSTGTVTITPAAVQLLAPTNVSNRTSVITITQWHVVRDGTNAIECLTSPTNTCTDAPGAGSHSYTAAPKFQSWVGGPSQSASVTIALVLTSVLRDGGNVKYDFRGNGAATTPAVVVNVCSALPCSGANIIRTASTSGTSGVGTAGIKADSTWLTGVVAGSNLSANTEYFAQATQGTVSSAVFQFYATTSQPAVPLVAIANGGATSQKADPGDTVTITFSEQLNASTLCSTWTNTGVQNLTDAVITLSDAGSNDTFATTSATCSTKLGTVTTGGDYVSGSVTFSASTITWDPIADTLTFKLGTTIGNPTNVRAGPVTVGKPGFTPTSGVTDLDGAALATTPVTSGAPSGF